MPAAAPTYSAEQISSMSPNELAMTCAADMLARETAASTLGIEIESMAEGEAVLAMTVQANMLNGHQTCHGGYLFSLADTAFAYACNSRNHASVGASCSIDYLAPGRAGDKLRAVAKEISLRGKTGIYDVSVYNQQQELLVLFRGKSHRISGAVLAATAAKN